MKQTVLVVDDLAIIRDPIAATLSGLGFGALCAGNGAEALEILRSQLVDLILLDVKMPVMDGLSFLRVLRRNPQWSTIPVIMLSGAEDREDILQAAKLGIKGYILKSNFSLKDLVTRVRQHFTGGTQPVPHNAQSESSSTQLAELNTIINNPNNPNATISAAPRFPGGTSALLDRDKCLERAKNSFRGKTLSGVVAEVIALSASPRSGATDLTAVIARDPLLSARVLQVANSAAYATSRGRISSLSDAVRNIGSSSVRNIAAALGVFNAMPTSDSNGLNLLRCWQHSFAVATLSNHLAGQQDSGVAYLVGLCHDLGEILFQSEFAEEYKQVLALQQSSGAPILEVEKHCFGITRVELMQTIITCLKLPKEIGGTILEYQSKGPAGRGGSPETRRLRAADLYANGMLLTSSNQDPIRPIITDEARDATGNENPPLPDRAAVRGEILSLTATLSRFSPQEQAEVLKPPFAQKPVRVWLARDPSLSCLDPVEAALELLADVTARNTLPTASEAAEHQAVVITAPNSSSPGFDPAALKGVLTPNGSPIPMLWLVGKPETPSKDIAPSPWPISLSKLADFIATAG